MLVASRPKTHTVLLPVSDDVLFALNQEKEQFEREFRVLLAIKYYEMGKLTTGLAAKMAGVPRSVFFHLLSQHNISPFGVDADELESDLAYATTASHI